MKIPAKEELEALYNECNETYFWGKLGKCSFMYFTKGNAIWHCPWILLFDLSLKHFYLQTVDFN